MFDVIIPNYQKPGITDLCLVSIMKHTRDVRTILINNGCQMLGSITASYSESAGDVTINCEENLGFIKATNMGIARSTAPYIVLQNNDTIIYNDIYAKMKKCFDDDANVGIVGCVFSPSGSWQCVNRLHTIYKEHAASHPDMAWTQEEHKKEALRIETEYKERVLNVGHMVIFACAMIKREVIEKVGYLSEEYGIGLGDDDDYCYRTRRAGYSVKVALDAYVYHAHRTTFKEMFTKEEIKTMEFIARDKFKAKYPKWRENR